MGIPLGSVLEGVRTTGNFLAGTDYESPLGNPAANGMMLASTTAGVRSWVSAAYFPSSVNGYLHDDGVGSRVFRALSWSDLPSNPCPYQQGASLTQVKDSAMLGGIAATSYSLTSHTLQSHPTTCTAAQLLLATGANAYAWTSITGDVTLNASGVTTIGANKVANAMLSQAAAYTVKGNNTASAANVADLTMAQLKAMLALALADLPTQVQSYDFNAYYPGKPTASQVIFQAKILRACQIQTGTHQGVAGASSTASAVFSIKKNGTQFGTATWAAAGTVPTFSVTQTTFAAGDIVTITAPSTPDSTLANITLGLFGVVQ